MKASVGKVLGILLVVYIVGRANRGQDGWKGSMIGG